MVRLPSVTRDQLKPEDQKYFDQISESRGGIRGPYGVLFHSPDLAARVASTGAYVRFESDMPNPLKEVVILTTAQELGNQFEFTGHARLARDAGVSEESIRAIAQGTALQGLNGDEAMLARFTIELVRDRKISDATFNAAKSKFGDRGVVDLTVLIGHYMLVAQVLTAFEVELAPGMTPELPG